VADPLPGPRVGTKPDPRARKRIIVTLRPSSSRYQAVCSSHLQRLIFYGPLWCSKRGFCTLSPNLLISLPLWFGSNGLLHAVAG